MLNQYVMNKGITKISVAGFKSIAKEASLDIKPLTLLAGANSSGKSSFMQPLLLMKQTLEAPYDPGPLLLNGANVRFTSFDQLLTSPRRKGAEQEFSIVLEAQMGRYIRSAQNVPNFVPYSRVSFHRSVLFFYRKDNQISVATGLPDSFHPRNGCQDVRICLDTSQRQLCDMFRKFCEGSPMFPIIEPITDWKITRKNFFLNIDSDTHSSRFNSDANETLSKNIADIIHVPGLRGNPQRAYSAGGIGPRFPGTFEHYTASVIAHWGDNDSNKLQKLGEQLSQLGLTSSVTAKRLDDTAIEISVGRLPKNGRRKTDTVNIADVGFGVSQTLPVLVALLVAEPGQLVYLEQPEIHLHPRAQRALAGILVDAANRGVKVVAETHSSMLLLAVQTLIAKQKISHENVALHWFERDDKTGMSKVETAKLDEAGQFGDWPVDFGEVELEAEDDYLDAVLLDRKEGVK